MNRATLFLIDENSELRFFKNMKFLLGIFMYLFNLLRRNVYNTLESC